MRLVVVVLALGLLGCGCASVPSRQGVAPQPDMNGVVRVIGRFGSAHACPFGDGRYAFTAAHVVDPRPFESGVPYFSARWSDGGGTSGVLEPIKVSYSSDLALVERHDKLPFGHPYPRAGTRPLTGDRVYILSYDTDSVALAMAPKIVSGSVVRVIADNLILDENSKPGSSGGCVLNERGEIVGVVAWGRSMADGGVIGIGVGVWAGIPELANLEAVIAKGASK